MTMTMMTTTNLFTDRLLCGQPQASVSLASSFILLTTDNVRVCNPIFLILSAGKFEAPRGPTPGHTITM